MTTYRVQSTPVATQPKLVKVIKVLADGRAESGGGGSSTAMPTTGQRWPDGVPS